MKSSLPESKLLHRQWQKVHSQTEQEFWLVEFFLGVEKYEHTNRKKKLLSSSKYLFTSKVLMMAAPEPVGPIKSTLLLSSSILSSSASTADDLSESDPDPDLNRIAYPCSFSRNIENDPQNHKKCHQSSITGACYELWSMNSSNRKSKWRDFTRLQKMHGRSSCSGCKQPH